MPSIINNLYQKKVKFIDGIEAKACSAFGVFCVLQNGISGHWNITKKTPNSRLFIGVGHPNESKRVIKYVPTHQKIHDELIENRNLVLSLYFGEIIQLWYDYLMDIYKELLLWNIYSDGHFIIQSENIKVDLSLPKEQLINSIIEGAVRNFDFLPANEKLTRVKKALSRSDDEWHVGDEYIKSIRINILIRNIMQHNLGIISEDDIKALGCGFFEEDYGDSIVKKSVGMKISRTPYDIEKLVDSMKEMANIIV